MSIEGIGAGRRDAGGRGQTGVSTGRTEEKRAKAEAEGQCEKKGIGEGRGRGLGGAGFHLWSANLEGKVCGEGGKAANDGAGNVKLPSQG